MVIIMVTLLIYPLVTTHESPSKVWGSGLRVQGFRFRVGA